MAPPPDIVLFIGRIHPLLVHLPIGFIVVLVALELLARRRRFQGANASAGYILALTVPVTVAGAACGWMLSLAGGYDAQLLGLHQWTGIATAGLCILTAIAYRLGNRKVYHGLLYGTAVALAVAGHFGGSLTHGRGYLLRHAPGFIQSLFGKEGAPALAPAAAASGPTADLRVFADVIQPLLERRCSSCHNADKKKGGLRLDTLEHLQKGGDGGPVLVPGRAGDSPLVSRLLLPADHDDRMPPAGKPQPALEEILLLQWWANAGAPAEQRVGELNLPSDVQQALEAITRPTK